jgi:hypothetical protein
MKPRRKKVAPAVEERERKVVGGDALSDFLQNDPSKVARLNHAKRAKGLSDLEVAVAEAERRARTADWEDADARAFVGFYAWCHRSVYGVLPVELDAIGEFKIAVRAAVRVLRERFDNDAVEMARFIRWSWVREKARSTWARSQNVDRNRMGWRLQFSDRQITDHRVAKSQGKA